MMNLIMNSWKDQKMIPWKKGKNKKTKYFFVDQEGLKMNFVQVMHIDGRKEHISLHVKTFIVHSFPMA